MDSSAVVSSPTESLILVDEHDREIGAASKHACHAGEGKLHRAFSVFIFNGHGELLLQQRSAQKPLWPLFWSNTCCSHPRVGETMTVAVERRLDEELGLRCEPRFLYKFKYHAPYEDRGSEREFCWVYAGHCDDEPLANDNELADWRFVSVAALDAELAATPERFTPWLKLEWVELKSHFLDDLLKPTSV
jgi:isopentenyl-diphosphate delta-isomerase